MNLTDYDAKYFAYELTKRCSSNSLEKLAGAVASAAGGKENWQGPAELTLNQSGGALAGTLVFTHPQAGRVQVPLTSGIVSKDAVTFSGQDQFPLGRSIEVTFHGTVRGTSLTGTTDMTSRGLFGRR